MGIANAGGLDTWQKVGLQATTGGVVESLSGGKFGHGFVSAGVTASVMPQVGHIRNDAVRTTVGALVGGTLSKATGGKFANGAVSGAIQGAMARSKSEARTSSAGGGGEPDPVKAEAAIRDADKALHESGFYKRVANREFTSRRQIALAWGKVAYPIGESHGVELGAWIARAPAGHWIVGGVYSDGAYGWVRPGLAPQPIHAATAWVHTHPGIPSGVTLSGGGALIHKGENGLWVATKDDQSDIIWAVGKGKSVYSYGGSPATLSSFDYNELNNLLEVGGTAAYACNSMVPACQ